MSDIIFKKIQWHSRRGMLELDMLLGKYTNNVFMSLSEKEQEIYIKLLACQDVDLFNWFMSNKRPDNKQLSEMIDHVLHYTRKNNEAYIEKE